MSPVETINTTVVDEPYKNMLKYLGGTILLLIMFVSNAFNHSIVVFILYVAAFFVVFMFVATFTPSSELHSTCNFRISKYNFIPKTDLLNIDFSFTVYTFVYYFTSMIITGNYNILLLVFLIAYIAGVYMSNNDCYRNDKKFIGLNILLFLVVGAFVPFILGYITTNKHLLPYADEKSKDACFPLPNGEILCI